MAQKILEKILPVFTPEWNATLNMIPDMNIVHDIPVILKSVTSEDSADGPLTTNRVIMWTLQFTMKAWLYGPIVSKPVIKFSNTHYFVGTPEENVANDIVQSVQVTPGLDANGNPTTNPNNSINPLLIDIDDDWSYAISQQNGVTIDFE